MFGLFKKKGKTPNPVVERLTKARDYIKGHFDPFVYMAEGSYCAVGGLMKTFVDEGKDAGTVYGSAELRLLNEATSKVSNERFGRIEAMAMSLPSDEAEEATLSAYDRAIKMAEEESALA